ncbi:hypothetical protein Tco_0684096 [Tanacetum coccineum]
MGDENPIRTFRDYSKPSHEGYRNTIELPEGKNAVPLHSDTIWTYSKKSLIMASIFSTKSKSFMTMSIPPQDEPSINRPMDARLSKSEADFKQQQGEMTNKIDIVLKAITDRITGALPSDTVKNPKLNFNPTTLVLSAHDSHEEELREDENTARRGVEVEYFNTFPTRIELAYHNSIIDPRLSQVVIGKPFIEISNMTHDLSLEVVKFIDGINEISYKMPYKIEEYDSLLDLEKENTKWVYLRNEEDKRRGVEYVMNKILVFYKECLELGPEYLTGVAE